jgi:hypothetical protein
MFEDLFDHFFSFNESDDSHLTTALEQVSGGKSSQLFSISLD